MDQLRNRGAALAAATTLVGAGLLAASPAAPIAVPSPPVQHVEVQLTDMFSALATNVDNFFTDTSAALTELAGLHLSDAAGDLIGSWLRLLFIPENLTIGALTALTGDQTPFLTLFPILYSADVLGTVWNSLTQAEPNLIITAVSDLFSFHLAGSYASAADAFNTILAVPGEVIVGTLMALGL